MPSNVTDGPDVVGFKTPSGFVGCDVGDGDVGCGVENIIQTKRYGGDEEIGANWWVKVSNLDAKPTIGPKGDLPNYTGGNGGATAVIPYDKPWRFGTTACVVTFNGLTCWDTTSGHGAFLNKTTIDTF